MNIFLELTESWQDGRYFEVGAILNAMTPREVAEFCAYFVKYLGTSQLEILYKFL